jgi:hypothetical protein
MFGMAQHPVLLGLFTVQTSLLLQRQCNTVVRIILIGGRTFGHEAVLHYLESMPLVSRSCLFYFNLRQAHKNGGTMP